MRSSAVWGERGEHDPLATVGCSDRTHATKPQGSDRREITIDAYATFILGAIAKDDITLIELQALLAERGTPVVIGTLGRFLDRHRITRN